MSLRLAALAAALLAATSAHALEARTYRGTLGKLPVILEITDLLPDGRVEGRYAYEKQGVDIPLHGKATGKAGLSLEEEAPCTVKLCAPLSGDDGARKPGPIGADWTLTLSEKAITGTWKDRKSGKSLPLSLSYVGSREIAGEIGPDTPIVVDYLAPGERAADYPYDFLKLKGPYRKGTVQEFNGSTFRIDEDDRIGVGYPVIETLKSGNPDAANAWLLDRRIGMVLRDYACMAKAYQGFGWFEYLDRGDEPYRSEQSGRLEYLSDRLVGVTEGGSFFCGGAHPDNSITYRLGNVATGESIEPESLVRGFTFRDYDGKDMKPEEATEERPGRYVADPALIARIKKERPVDESEADSGCEMDSLIDEYLSVALKGHELVFLLKDVPHYASACAGDLLSIPLKDAADAFTDEGRRLIVELDG